MFYSFNQANVLYFDIVQDIGRPLLNELTDLYAKEFLKKGIITEKIL